MRYKPPLVDDILELILPVVFGDENLQVAGDLIIVDVPVPVVISPRRPVIIYPILVQLALVQPSVTVVDVLEVQVVNE